MPKYSAQEAAATVLYLLTQPSWVKAKEDEKNLFYGLSGYDKEGQYPYIMIRKARSTDIFQLTVQLSEGSEMITEDFVSGGYKKAQEKASLILAQWVASGLELSLNN